MNVELIIVAAVALAAGAFAVIRGVKSARRGGGCNCGCGGACHR